MLFQVVCDGVVLPRQRRTGDVTAWAFPIMWWICVLLLLF